MSGFEGHVKRSTLTSAFDTEFPDRVVEARTRATGTAKALVLDSGLGN